MTSARTDWSSTPAHGVPFGQRGLPGLELGRHQLHVLDLEGCRLLGSPRRSAIPEGGRGPTVTSPPSRRRARTQALDDVDQHSATVGRCRPERSRALKVDEQPADVVGVVAQVGPSRGTHGRRRRRSPLQLLVPPSDSQAGGVGCPTPAVGNRCVGHRATKADDQGGGGVYNSESNPGTPNPAPDVITLSQFGRHFSPLIRAAHSGRSFSMLPVWVQVLVPGSNR